MVKRALAQIRRIVDPEFQIFPEKRTREFSTNERKSKGLPSWIL